MAGTIAGGLKAAATNRKLHGDDFYARIGRKGGQKGHTGGFAANPLLAKLAGARGGRRSRRGPSLEAQWIYKNRKELNKRIAQGKYTAEDIAKKTGLTVRVVQNYLQK